MKASGFLIRRRGNDNVTADKQIIHCENPLRKPGERNGYIILLFGGERIIPQRVLKPYPLVNRYRATLSCGTVQESPAMPSLFNKKTKKPSILEKTNRAQFILAPYSCEVSSMDKGLIQYSTLLLQLLLIIHMVV